MTRRELLVAAAALAITKSLPLRVLEPPAPPAPECRSRFCRHFEPDPTLAAGKGRCGSGSCA